MIDWNNIIERSHAIAKEKGWWDEPRSAEECLMLAVTEVAEAVEWYRDFKDDLADVFKPSQLFVEPSETSNEFIHKPVGIPSELADVCIRLCDMIGHKNQKCYGTTKPIATVAGDFIVDCFRLSRAIILEPSENALEYALMTATHYGIDLAAAIEAKLAYNATREKRHGGKRA